VHIISYYIVHKIILEQPYYILLYAEHNKILFFSNIQTGGHCNLFRIHFFYYYVPIINETFDRERNGKAFVLTNTVVHQKSNQPNFLNINIYLNGIKTIIIVLI